MKTNIEPDQDPVKITISTPIYKVPQMFVIEKHYPKSWKKLLSENGKFDVHFVDEIMLSIENHAIGVKRKVDKQIISMLYSFTHYEAVFFTKINSGLPNPHEEEEKN